MFEFLRNSELDARNFFDLASVPPFRRNQFGGALGGPVKKDKLFLFGNYEGFRQALALSSVSVVPDIWPVEAFSLTVSLWLSWIAPSCPTWLSGRSRMAGNSHPLRTAWRCALLQQSATAYSRRFRHFAQRLRAERPRYSSAAYTIDDGDDLLPLADPLFGSNVTLRSQVASLEETHIFSPHLLNTFTAGFSRAAFNYNSFPLTSFPADLSFVTGADPGGIVIGGGVTTTGGGSHYRGRNKQRGKCLEPPQSVHLHRQRAGHPWHSSVERRRLVSAHAG